MKRAAKRGAPAGHRPVLVFLAKCLVFWGAALLLVSRFSFVEHAGVGLTLWTLKHTLGLMGQKVELSGSAIFMNGASVEIVSDCSPHMPFLIFAAVILAFPSTWKQRLLGLLLGAVVIHVFNTIRIITLMWILSWKRDWFEFAHVYLWQTGTILIVFVTFAMWIRTLSRRPKPA